MLAEARVRLWIVVLAVGALLLAALVWQLDRDARPDRATPSAGSSCADLRLFLVPGNAQGDASDPGPVLDRFADRFDVVDDGRRTVERIVVANPSKSVRVLGARYPNRPANAVITAAQVRSWETGVNVAATDLLAALSASAKSCPNTALVVAGYSQGAGAVHRAVVKVSDSTDVGRRLIGVVLLGDPDRRRETRATSAFRPAADGIEYSKRLRIGDLPVSGSSRVTHSICLYGDLVCAFGRQPIRTGIGVHDNYLAQPAAVYDAPARSIMNVAVAIPRVNAGAPTVQGAVGDQFRHAIPVRVLSSALSQVVFSARSPLPPGLQLTSSGLLTGLPTTAGSTVVKYRVQNTGSTRSSMPVVGFLTVVVKASAGLRVSAGGESVCVVRVNHALNCWGANGYGQLGDGSKTDRRGPVRIGVGTWNEIATSGTHTCGVRTSSSLWCWGNNRYGQLGNGTTTESKRPIEIARFAKWRTVAANTFNSCAITTGGGLWCWGNNIWGQVGNGTTTTARRPQSLGTGWTSVSAGSWSTCGTKVGGQMWCWGANDFGQLGDGTKSTRTRPVRIGSGFSWTGVSIGSMHGCGLVASGGIRCWGTNISGQLGTGSTASSLRPAAVFGDSRWRDVAAGDLFTCGIKLDGSVWCWGAGAVGQRGSGIKGPSGTPVRVTGALAATRVSATWSHACGVDAETFGAMSCWGFNNRGQLGDGSTTLRTQPTRVALP